MQFEIVIDDTGFREKMAKVKDFTPFNAMLHDAFNKALDIAKKLTPGKGTIRREWLTEFMQDAAGRTTEAVLRNNYKNQDVLRYLEFGTPAHKIKPKSPGGFIVFWSRLAIGTTWKDKSGKVHTNTTGWVRTKRVDHPGTKSYDILGTTRKYLLSQIAILKDKFLDSVLDGAS